MAPQHEETIASSEACESEPQQGSSQSALRVPAADQKSPLGLREEVLEKNMLKAAAAAGVTIIDPNATTNPRSDSARIKDHAAFIRHCSEKLVVCAEKLVSNGVETKKAIDRVRDFYVEMIKNMDSSSRQRTKFEVEMKESEKEAMEDLLMDQIQKREAEICALEEMHEAQAKQIKLMRSAIGYLVGFVIGAVWRLKSAK
ncbi:hypothetical protein F4810DRAFT_711778 [Camillea tinctor]|nr:hypothetical protein F4810DRAFT_711778 [Camillea tinctor]